MAADVDLGHHLPEFNDNTSRFGNAEGEASREFENPCSPVVTVANTVLLPMDYDWIDVGADGRARGDERD